MKQQLSITIKRNFIILNTQSNLILSNRFKKNRKFEYQCLI